MKKIILLLALIPNLAIAQGWQIPNPAGTPRALPTPGTVMTKANVDTFGNQLVVPVDGSGSGETQSVIPVSNAVNLNGVGSVGVGYYFAASDSVEAASTTTVLNLTSHVARVGDAISLRSGTAGNVGAWSTVSAVTANTVTLSNALPATPAAADSLYILRPAPIGVTANTGGAGSTYHSTFVNIDRTAQDSATNGILKAEDAASANSDALVGVAGVVNQGLLSKAADGDYTAPALDTAGGVYLSVGTGLSPLVLEDNAAANGDALAKVAGVANDNLDVKAATGDYLAPALDVSGAAFIAGGSNGIWKFEDATRVSAEALLKLGTTTNSALAADSATNGDWTWAKADELGRTITTLAPAGESWQACATSTATTSEITIKSAVPSNRIYVTAVTCSNTSATVGTAIYFKDGSTSMATGGVGSLQATSSGSFAATFPVPLRGTVNTAFNFNASVAVTSLFCCASGYISVN